VINENDSVATEEIRFGDNDRLAARVAQAAGASGVILLSDIDGLYDRNPADPAAEHIPRVERIDASIEAMADSGSTSGMGSGGMVSKIAAARIAASAGASLAILSGHTDRPLSSPARHTLFIAEGGANARKAWLAGGLTAAGKLTIDAGAVRALSGGASLLAAGVTAVRGQFERGDVLDIAGPDGRVIARGLSEYASDEAAKLIGLPRDAQEAALGHTPRSAMVHRDHLVVM
jgi:glutamate 5-kinase